MTPASPKKQTPTRLRFDTPPSMPAVNASADALLRASVEACRQHERVSILLEKACDEAEVHDAAAACELSQQQLLQRTAAYEAAAGGGQGATADVLWHVSNTLWHASREYARRHESCEETASARMTSHSSEKLGELTMEYELAASALLALRQAIDNYRKLRPDAG